MVDYQIPTKFSAPFSANSFHLRDDFVALNASGDESVFPASTLSPRSDYASSSDVTSLMLTARSASPTNLFEEDGISLSASGTSAKVSDNHVKWTKDSTFPNLPLANKTSPKMLETVTPQLTNYFSEQHSTMFMPITAESVCGGAQRSRTPSPGISKMLLSLSDHVLERPCTPNASTLYKNTKTHCNPSELGQQTYDECMVSLVLNLQVAHYADTDSHRVLPPSPPSPHGMIVQLKDSPSPHPSSTCKAHNPSLYRKLIKFWL